MWTEIRDGIAYAMGEVRRELTQKPQKRQDLMALQSSAALNMNQLASVLVLSFLTLWRK